MEMLSIQTWNLILLTMQRYRKLLEIQNSLNGKNNAELIIFFNDIIIKRNKLTTPQENAQKSHQTLQMSFQFHCK